jgi:cell division protein FtsB
MSNALTAHKVVVSDLVEEKKANQGKVEQLTQSTKQLEDNNSLLRQGRTERHAGHIQPLL